ncbi:MAG: hypothetical protein O3A01_07365 [bacterium]|nr:hypothetical protein [bacterium]
MIPGKTKFRIRTGSKGEIIVFVGLVLLLGVSLPISEHGLYSSLRWLLATPESAAAEFGDTRNYMFVTFDGRFDETNTPLGGVAEVLSAQSRKLIVRFDGKIYTMSNRPGTDIVAKSVRVLHTEQPVERTNYEFHQQTRDALLAQLPDGVLITGSVILPEKLKLDIPETDFPSIKQTRNRLVLTYATKAEIANVVLDQFFEITRKKEAAKLGKITMDLEAAKTALAALEANNDLTEKGKAALMTEDQIQTETKKRAKLIQDIHSLTIQHEEQVLNVATAQALFSGNVTLRTIPEPPTPQKMDLSSSLPQLDTIWKGFL